MNHHISYRLFFIILTALSPLLDAAQLRVPQPDMPGLLIPDDAIPLTQADFSSGSYRIKKPGYYYLVEDIFFNPDPTQEAMRTDKPRIGAWFCALSIECDNVVIDLNTKTFAAHSDFLDSQKLKVFSLIEFGNSPFPLIKFPFFGYTGETVPVFSNNVVVKNGTIGASPHHGLHGNSNSNIQIYDVVIRDWEVAGIAFNGLKSGVIRNVTITGLEHAMDFTGLVSVMLAAKVVLEDLRDNYADTGAQAYLNALQTVIDDPQANGSIHPTRLNYGNVYGIYLNRAFDIGPVAAHATAQHSNAIIIENVLIANITSRLLEVVAIGNVKGQTMMAELFGTFRWEDAYPNGTFAPNALLKAQVYVQQQRAPAKMPDGFAENILSNTPREDIFLSHAQPVFGVDFPGHANKGIFGIRVDAGYGVSIKNCSIMGLNNLGLPGKRLSTVPGGKNYRFAVPRYAGNDVYGISLAVCRNCTIADCDISECSSTHGNVHGIVVRNYAQTNHISDVLISNLQGLKDNEKSTVNPSSRVYGIVVDTQAAANTIMNASIQTLSAPRYVYGIYVHDAIDTQIKRSLVSHITASADSRGIGSKRVIAYATVGSYATSIEQCVARVLQSVDETAYLDQSALITAGYMIGDTNQNDYNAIIDNSKSEILNGGTGIAAGVFLSDAYNVTIKHNELMESVAAQGYGIYNKLAKELTGFVFGNRAYGNSTKNYETFGARWPTLMMTNSSVPIVSQQSGWHNLSIEV